MTVIILQIMRFGLYSTVDTNLQNAAYNANDYVARTMKRSDSLQVDDSDYESFSADENGSKLKSALNGETLTNVSVLLYDKKGKILNALDAFLQFGALSYSLDDIVDLVIEEGVKVVTTGAGNPGKYMERFHEAGITVIPVVPSVALARRMEKLGADAVIAEGMEAGGHIGKLTTMTLVRQVVDG